LNIEGNTKVRFRARRDVYHNLTSLYLQILGNVIAQGKKLGKAVYVFSVDQEGNRVVHGNYVPETVKAKGLDARTWASKVVEILGGKVGLCLELSINRSQLTNILGRGQGRELTRRWD
jgi:hypothetical protein